MTLLQKRLLILGAVVLSAAVLGRLAATLKEYSVPHEYILFPHSGHGLQNDNKLYAQYMDKVVEYLDKYMEG